MNMPPFGQQSDAFYSYAAQRLQAGFAPQMVVNELVHQGMNPKAASAMVQNIRGGGRRKQASRQSKEKARLNGVGIMLLGATFFVIGIGISVWTYKKAKPGQSYVVAVGLIVTGALGFIGGILQIITGHESQSDD